MEFKTLSNIKVSKLCLGTWALGGKKYNNVAYGDISYKRCEEILNYSINKKVNFFDTANVYGDAEYKLGKILKNFREDIFIGTKVGCVSFKKKLNFSKSNIINQINNTLKNLKSDYIDMVQLYGPSIGDEKINEAFDTLNSFRERKKIRYIGISLRNPKDYLFFRKKISTDFVQCNFNLLDNRLLEKSLFEKINKDRTNIYIRTILNFGIFTEEFLNSRKKFKKNDHRSTWNYEQILKWIDAVNKIKKISNRKIEDTAYRFCNSFNFSGLIIGANKINHIKTALKKSNQKKLTKNELDKIISIRKDFEKKLFVKPKYKMKS